MKNLFTISLLSLVVWLVVSGIWTIQLKQDCTGHLKRAADANTIELAQKELAVTVNYLEQQDLTSGYTSALWKTPDEDIGFWYANLTASYQELLAIDSAASNLEKSNMLIKLRETIMDEDGSTTIPGGLARYPYNLIMGVWFWISAVLFLIVTIAIKES